MRPLCNCKVEPIRIQHSPVRKMNGARIHYDKQQGKKKKKKSITSTLMPGNLHQSTGSTSSRTICLISRQLSSSTCSGTARSHDSPVWHVIRLRVIVFFSIWTAISVLLWTCEEIPISISLPLHLCDIAVNASLSHVCTWMIGPSLLLKQTCVIRSVQPELRTALCSALRLSHSKITIMGWKQLVFSTSAHWQHH